MKTVITADFTCHPGAPDDQTERKFRVDDEPTDLSDEFVAMLIGKGLAKHVADAPAEPAGEPETPAAVEVAAEAEIPTPRTKRAPR